MSDLTENLKRRGIDTRDFGIDLFATVGAGVAASVLANYFLPAVPYDNYIPGVIGGIVAAVTWRRLRRDN